MGFGVKDSGFREFRLKGLQFRIKNGLESGV